MSDKRYRLTPLQAALVMFGGMPIVPTKQRVATPDGCERCDFRQPHMRDGGWCYMFKEAPAPTCAQFRPSPAAGGEEVQS